MNKKGFTLIELITCVALMSIVIIPAFSIIVSYKNKYQISSDKKELIKFQYLVTSRIQQDVLQKGLKCLAWGETTSCPSGTTDNIFYVNNRQERKIAKDSSDKKYKFTLGFRDGTYKYIELDVPSKKIKYYGTTGGVSADNDEYILPVQYAEILDYPDVMISFSRTYIDYSAQKLDESSFGEPFLSIFIPIKYIDDTNSEEVLDYGIHITAEKAQWN